MHTPTGHTAGTVPVPALHVLYEGFIPQGHHADKCFEAVVAGLLQRRAAELNHKKAAWRAPERILTALQDAFAVETELFADALQISPRLTHYYTGSPADSDFGGNANPYSSAWTGYCLCIPQEDDKGMNKALRWAIASASVPSTASLTVMVLPVIPSTAYRRWLNHPLVHTVLQVPWQVLEPVWYLPMPDRCSKAPRTVFILCNNAARTGLDFQEVHDILIAACAREGFTCPSLTELHVAMTGPHTCQHGNRCGAHAAPSTRQRPLGSCSQSPLLPSGPHMGRSGSMVASEI